MAQPCVFCAIVRGETYQGKGHVVRRMFNDVEAEIYVLVDGDATYDATSAPAMIGKLLVDSKDATPEQVEKALKLQGRRIGEVMVDEGMISADTLTKTLTAQKAAETSL